MDLTQFLTTLATGAGSVYVIKWLFGLEWFRQFNFTSNAKRLAAITLCFLLGIGSALALIYAGNTPLPIDAEAWLNALWPAATNAFVVSQLVLSWLKSVKPEFGKAK